MVLVLGGGKGEKKPFSHHNQITAIMQEGVLMGTVLSQTPMDFFNFFFYRNGRYGFLRKGLLPVVFSEGYEGAGE